MARRHLKILFKWPQITLVCLLGPVTSFDTTAMSRFNNFFISLHPTAQCWINHFSCNFLECCCNFSFQAVNIFIIFDINLAFMKKTLKVHWKSKLMNSNENISSLWKKTHNSGYQIHNHNRSYFRLRITLNITVQNEICRVNGLHSIALPIIVGNICRVNGLHSIALPIIVAIYVGWTVSIPLLCL